MELLFLMVDVVIAVICAFIASDKERSPLLWGILGVFLFYRVDHHSCATGADAGQVRSQLFQMSRREQLGKQLLHQVWCQLGTR